MNCLACHKTCNFDEVNICLDQSCSQNILCSNCMINHPSYHERPIRASKFLHFLSNQLPDELVLQNINSQKVLSELEKNYQRGKKLFKQLKESIISQIDIAINQISSLYDHLHSQYSQYHAKITNINSQRYLIQNIISEQTQESLLNLLQDYNKNSIDHFISSQNKNSINNNSAFSPQRTSSSLKNQSQYKSPQKQSSIEQLTQSRNNLYKKFESVHKEVCSFNEFSQQILEKELDKSSQLMYENFENIKKFITNCVSMSQKQKNLLKNKFLDTLQPLFQKEEQIICHKNNMPVQAMVINSKQNQVITASFDCNIIVRDLITLKEIQSFQGHSQWIRSLTLQESSINNPFHYSNSLLISCGDDKLVQLWKINSQINSMFAQNSCSIESQPSSPSILENLTFQLNLKASLVCMVSTNSVAVCAGPTEQHNIFIYDIQNGQLLQILKGHKKYVRSIIYLEDNNWLCTGSDDGLIGIWNLQGINNNNSNNNDNFKYRINASAFPVQALIYEEKNSLICGGTQDGKILIYSIKQTPKLIKIIQCSTCTQVSALCKLNSNYFVAAVGKNILVYCYQTGSLINSINNKNNSNISIIAYCPQNLKLFVGDVRGQLSQYAVLIV